MLGIIENPLFKIFINIGLLYICYRYYCAYCTVVLYCMDPDTEMALEIKNINEKTKNDLRFYEDMEKNGILK
jgi:hypothetical protein